jgi:hypothetical protein
MLAAACQRTLLFVKVTKPVKFRCGQGQRKIKGGARTANSYYSLFGLRHSCQGRNMTDSDMALLQRSTHLYAFSVDTMR